MIKTPLWAGFESARLPWSGRDMLEETRHTPQTDMWSHYLDLPDYVVGARDCLSWRHSRWSRVQNTKIGLPIMWDMVHFDMPPDPEEHADICESVLGQKTWAIAVNEPTIHAEFNKLDGSWSTVETAIRMMKAAPRLRYAACDALCTLDPVRWWATDKLVESGLVELVGLNFYPHSMSETPTTLIREAKKRYPGIKISITETGWHWGHPDLNPEDCRRQWLDYITAVCDYEGDIEFICWFPWLDMPDWNDPSKPHWLCGWPG